MAIGDGYRIRLRHLSHSQHYPLQAPEAVSHCAQKLILQAEQGYMIILDEKYEE